MRTSATFDATWVHFGLWQAGVTLLALLAASALAAWAFFMPAPWSVPMAVGLLGGIPCIVVAAVVALRCAPTRLRWDGSRWWWSRGVDPRDPAPVELTVCVDLGGWMLLRLDGGGGLLGRTVAWLPVQRRGHEEHWHALRCAVYSPRPVPGGPSVADP